jgi:hypothetical protein
VELRGAINDEVGAWRGTTLYFDKDSLLENLCEDDDCPYFKKKSATANKIIALWQKYGYSWFFIADINIPFEPFTILENGEKYCRGLVFNMDSLKA